MKPLTCEMCGGTDLVKQDGLFVCQFCGTKYSVEEAKKMMIEGTVDVTGTVKVDNSAYVEKYLANARRAKEKEDWEETEKYYNMVEQNDPTNIEAIFYSAYGKARNSLNDPDLFKRQAAFKVLTNCVSLIDDNYTLINEKEEKETIAQISQDIIKMASTGYVFNEEKTSYSLTVSSDREKTLELFDILGVQFINSLNQIVAKYPEGDNRTIVFLKLAIKHTEFIIKHGARVGAGDTRAMKEKFLKLHETWNQIDASHEIPKETPKPVPKQSSGCYIATAVYGSYDCPEVWTLRRFRDRRLARTWFGRAFIRTYYAISPTLVKWFGQTGWFQKLWRGWLDRVVDRLHERGYEDTPYED